MKAQKNKWEQKKQIQKLIRIINDRMIDIKCLKGGLIMSDKSLVMMFQEHPRLKKEWNVLIDRKDKLKKLLWKLP